MRTERFKELLQNTEQIVRLCRGLSSLVLISHNTAADCKCLLVF